MSCFGPGIILLAFVVCSFVCVAAVRMIAAVCMPQHVLRVTLADLQAAEDSRMHGPLESRLLELLAAVKRRERGRSIVVRIDFPQSGGLEMRCHRLSWLSLPVRLWED